MSSHLSRRVSDLLATRLPVHHWVESFYLLTRLLTAVRLALLGRRVVDAPRLTAVVSDQLTDVVSRPSLTAAL